VALKTFNKLSFDKISSEFFPSKIKRAKWTSSENSLEILMSKSIIGSLGEVEALPLEGINKYDNVRPIVIMTNRKKIFLGFATKNLEVLS